MNKIEAAIHILLGLIAQGHPLAPTLSGGKDSTVTTILCLEAIRRANAKGMWQAEHHVSSASTGVENPAMESHLLDIHGDIEDFVAAHHLPVAVVMVQPSLASSFVVTTIGRGTLPRFPENGKDRQCSVDWKVKPQQRLSAALARQSQQQGTREAISVIGTRFAESDDRSARMASRGESSLVPVRNASGHLVLSLIAQWSLQDVWDTLELFLDAKTAPFPSFTSSTSIYRLFELYRDANEGACGINLGDGGNKAPCGPRFGCWACCITGDRDKSMESMLRDEKYQHMQGLNDFRNLLIATQHDMGRRELVGRTISKAGYLPIGPDVYRLEFRRKLLQHLLTLDVLEEERAERMEADIFTGRVPDTPANRRMATAQFENVTLSQLVAVDFYWSMHHYAANAFPAIEVWYDIRVLGRRYPVTQVAKAPKTTFPAKRWYQVGAFDKDVPTDGLRDYVGEQWNTYWYPDRPFTHRVVDGSRTAWFEEEDSLEVDALKANQIVTCEYPGMMLQSRQHAALASARFWLSTGTVKLPTGMAARYQHMAKRAQYFAQLVDLRNVTPAELDAHLLSNSISDAQHEEILGSMPKSVDVQSDLFSLAA